MAKGADGGAPGSGIGEPGGGAGTDGAAGAKAAASARPAGVSSRRGGHGDGTRGRNLRWPRRVREAFLDQLAGSCDVEAAAAAAGVDPDAIHAYRRRDAQFAADWRMALARGYELLETLVVGHALAGGGPTVKGGDPARPAIDVELALRLLARRQGVPARADAVGAPAHKAATREQTNVALIRKLDAFERRRALPSIPLPPPIAADAAGIDVPVGDVR